MRYCVLIAGLVGLMLTGCNQSSPPKPRRGVPLSVGNGSRPAASDEGVGAVHTGKPLDTGGGPVRVDSITLTAPKGWGRKQPRSSFIQAEFMLPRAEGDKTDGRLTVSTAGGSIEENIDRWKGQFSGAQEKAHQERIDVGGTQVTLVDLSGEYNDQPGPFAPAVQCPGHRMIAAIIPVNGQLHFVKAVGPQKTMAARAEEVKAFVRSVKRNE